MKAAVLLFATLVCTVSFDAQAAFACPEQCSPAQREAFQFLVENMPEADRDAISNDFILETVNLALLARDEHSWAREIPNEIFLNNVLPYASVNEKRENWRKDFRERFGGLVKDCKSCGEAALVLNAKIFKQVNVGYHPTKRPKADQSPSESIAAGFASCSGLSIMLIDACRAVGVPARFVGTPSWTTGKGDANGNHGGNHSWVEIWDGQWHVLGAIEVSPLSQTWFLGNASKADPTQPIHCIYASSFKKTGLSFPLVWAETIKYVQAEDVTQSYLRRTPVKIEALARPGGTAVPVRFSVRLNGRLIADVADSSGTELILSAGHSYEALISRPGYAAAPVTFRAPVEKGNTVSFVLGE